ncbi:putative nitrogen permease reactivator protein [Podospora fimiseda]|uniref:non-specific serine/threonine protein kinase n=1 Tax=Podospora fimiseda TaxID=252190 RepID=A0AAN7BI27_9PEZI|nr:putative nitrogen permease reactivator protein [Podospora fimiseda]
MAPQNIYSHHPNNPQLLTLTESAIESEIPSSPAVRFKSTIEEIAPDNAASCPQQQHVSLGDPSQVSPEELRDLSDRLKACPLQERRMNIFSYDPISLPASRVRYHDELTALRQERTASRDDDSREPSREPTRSSAGHGSPHLNATTAARSPEMHTPPLTPAGTESTEAGSKREQPRNQEHNRRTPDIITPQDSLHEQDAQNPARLSVPQPTSITISSERERVSRRPATSDGRDTAHLTLGDHRKGLFSLGAASGSNSPASSVPPSRDTSPSRSAVASQFYTRQVLPGGDANDPYSAHRRTPHPTKPSSVEPRFIFAKKKNKGSYSPSSSQLSLPRVSCEKRLTTDEGILHSRNSSMADLKRFFKLGSKSKRTASPAPSVKSGTKTPPSSKSTPVPFGDDHGLSSKYGKLGRVLGAGAGGSVRLMKRAEDSTVFAVKEFRPRHSYETEREYVKKLTAEYCMGSTLHHGNIIETLDIVQEKGKWYEVMEYAPYDLFAIVMTGKMSREEVTCCFLQILSGVTYLHSLGLAHRDLKLDNVVVSQRGIMKIIDFGSAHVFKYPFETGTVLASGIVGSDPYLAPEVYDEKKYDPTAVDIWSLAIIYCCMTLRRFPWKLPRMTDTSYKLFAADPTPGHDPRRLILPPSASTSALNETPLRDVESQSVGDAKTSASTVGQEGGSSGGGGEKKEVVRGPWRILRLLPRDSRYIISRMLDLDPKTRATMDEILDDPWVANTVICRQMGPGHVANADDHTHVLEPPTPPAPK